MKTLLLAALVLATAAQAQPPARDVHELHVAYGDLNLNNQTGAQALMQRLDHAADQVCGPQPALRDLDRAGDFNSCRKDALDKAVARIASPQLAAVYGAQIEQRVASK